MTNPTNQAGGVAEPDDERAKFEAWFCEDGNYELEWLDGRAFDGGFSYSNADTENMWQAWQARASLATKPAAPAEVVAEDEDKNYPFYELRFIMRVLGHKGRAPEQDWETAYGMAKEIFSKCHKERIAALRTPAQEPSTGAVANVCGRNGDWPEDDAWAITVRVLQTGKFPTINASVPAGAELVPFVREVLAAAPPVVHPASPAVEVASK